MTSASIEPLPFIDCFFADSSEFNRSFARMILAFLNKSICGFSMFNDFRSTVSTFNGSSLSVLGLFRSNISLLPNLFGVVSNGVSAARFMGSLDNNTFLSTGLAGAFDVSDRASKNPVDNRIDCVTSSIDSSGRFSIKRFFSTNKI